MGIDENRDKTVFEPESVNIEDPDECADPTLNDCDPNAICQNVQLSFTCACREGFEDKGHPGGPGRNCVENDNSTLVIAEKLARVERRFEAKYEAQDAKIDDVEKSDEELRESDEELRETARSQFGDIVNW